MNIIQNLGAWFSAFPAQMRLVEWTDVLDMVVLALAYFWIYRFIRDRRGGRLIIGIGALFVVFLGAVVLRLHAMEFILRSLFQIGLLALLMLFQPEVRSALERLSAQPLRLSRRLRSKSRDHKLIVETVEEICNTAGDLSRKKTGALIVIERTTRLGDVINSGIPVDAKLTSHLLQNIFFKDAPLHDGAVIVRNYRICAAGCFLPLTEQTDVDANLGTRHRAALGISETSDAVTVVVSEETGHVSLTFNRRLFKNVSLQTLRSRLFLLLTEQDEEESGEDAKKGGAADEAR